MAKANTTMPKPDDEATTSTAVDLNPSRFSREELASITSFEDAMKLAVREHGGVVNAHEVEELGDGFRIASESDKEKLVGVPLFFLDWNFREGDFGEYVSIRAIQQREDKSVGKWVINDGSTGLREQLKEFETLTGRAGGLNLRNGLRVSNYRVDAESREPITRNQVREYDAKGRKHIPAATYYLDASA